MVGRSGLKQNLNVSTQNLFIGNKKKLNKANQDS